MHLLSAILYAKKTNVYEERELCERTKTVLLFYFRKENNDARP